MKKNYEYLDGSFTLDLMKVPTYSKMEYRLVAFIIRWCGQNNVDYEFDTYGNLYLTKGKIEGDDGYYPCVTAHLDSVQKAHKELIASGELIKVLERTNKEGNIELYAKGMGLGADDKCGVLIALTMFQHLDVLKAAFFLEEEIGCLGSEQLNVEWFNNVGYVIGYDSPDRNRAAWSCSGVKLFNQDFFENHIKEVCEKNGLTKFYSEPFTDVKEIRQKVDVQCMNFGSGYYNAHSDNEYIVVEEVDEAVKLGVELVQHLGNKRYFLAKEESKGKWGGYTNMYKDPEYEFMSNLGDNDYINKYRSRYGSGLTNFMGGGSFHEDSYYDDDYYGDYFQNLTYGYGDIDKEMADVEEMSSEEQAEYWQLTMQTKHEVIKKYFEEKKLYEETITYLVKKYEESFEVLKDKIQSRCEVLGIDFESEFKDGFDDGLPF